MNSRIPMNSLSHRLILISAAILISANSTLAASRVGDAQIQAGDLLAGTVGGRPKIIDKSPAISADRHQESPPDPQTQARELILGKSSVRGGVSRQFEAQSNSNAAVAVPAQRIGSTHTDPQELARRMILGAADSRIARQALKQNL
jgi:hypothetical protein